MRAPIPDAGPRALCARPRGAPLLLLPEENRVSTPAVSVLMSVHNGERWLKDAVDSILNQTMLDLELIVMDDASTDGTVAILDALPDKRLIIGRWHRHEGLTRQLCRAMTFAQAPLIARLDADDTASPDRLEVQREFMKAYPHIGLLGTAALLIDHDGVALRTERPPLVDSDIRRELIRHNPFIHSSVMMRRSVVDQVGGYDPSVLVAQDYDLWMRMATATQMANLFTPYVKRRLHSNQVSNRRQQERRRTEARVRWRAVRRGQYPWWCAAFALKPLVALALSSVWREARHGCCG